MTEDDPRTASLLAELRQVCAKLRDAFSSSSGRLTYLCDAIARPDLGELREGLPFRVEQWNTNDLLQVVAACANLLVAVGAFEAAVHEYPSHHWLLRHGARVIREHTPS